MDAAPSEGFGAREREAVYRKVFRRLIPFLMLCYSVAYLDRVNVGFAKLGMSGELGLSEAVYGLGAGIFFVGYFFFEVPSNAMLHRIGARTWITRIMITWAVLSAACAFISGPISFYVLRFLLGVAEAGFFPGIILYLTYWFPAAKRGRVIAIFMIAIPLAGLVGGPLSGGIMTWFDGLLGWAGWRWMFVVEAIPALLLGIAFPFVMRSRVSDVGWLSETEKAIVAEDLAKEDGGITVVHGNFSTLLRDPMIMRLGAIYFCCILGQYGITFWLPSLVSQAAQGSTLLTGILTALPYACAVILMPIVSARSDRTGERHWHTVVPMAIGGLALFSAAASGNALWLAIPLLCIGTAATLAATPMFWTLPTAIMRGRTAAVGIAAINSIGNIAGFASPSIVGYVNGQTGSAVAGMGFLTTALLCGGGLVLSLRTSSRS